MISLQCISRMVGQFLWAPAISRQFLRSIELFSIHKLLSHKETKAQAVTHAERHLINFVLTYLASRTSMLLHE